MKKMIKCVKKLSKMAKNGQKWSKSTKCKKKHLNMGKGGIKMGQKVPKMSKSTKTQLLLLRNNRKVYKKWVKMDLSCLEKWGSIFRMFLKKNRFFLSTIYKTLCLGEKNWAKNRPKLAIFIVFSPIFGVIFRPKKHYVNGLKGGAKWFFSRTFDFFVFFLLA